MRKSRGAALGTALLVALIITTLGFALSGASLTHLSLNTRSNNSEQASNLARSVVSKAVDRLFKDETYGQARTDVPLQIQLNGPVPGSEGLLTFNKTEAANFGIPYSTNNLQGSSQVEGPGGKSIPVDKIHLVGIGRVAGVERKVEVMLHVPPYPYAVSSEGPIHALRGARVGGLDELPAGSAIPLDFSDVSPADMLSNGNGADAVRLGENTEISGDVISSGGIQLEAPNVAVLGELRPNQSPSELPGFQLEKYDPSNIGIHETLDESFYSGGQVFEGMIKRQGDVSFQGGVELNDGLMFVDGNVTISGGLRGSGLVVTTGTLTVTGGAQLASDSKLALLSEGDVVLNGSGTEGSYFQGTVYTKSGVQAEDLTVVGTLIAAGRNDSVRLENARVFSLPDSGSRQEWAVRGASNPAPTGDSIKILPRAFSAGVDVWLSENPDGTIKFTLQNQLRPPRSFDVPVGTPDPTISALIDRELRSLGVALSGANRMAWHNAVRDHNWSSYMAALINGGQTDPDDDTTSIIVVDPSEFLTLKDKVRILLWTES